LSADSDAVAVDELSRTLDELAVYANSVAAVQVLQCHGTRVQEHPGVAARNQRVFECNLAVVAAAHIGRTGLKIDFLEIESESISRQQNLLRVA
jgi:hypothetical protein